jgi:hypothetical protein
MLPPLLQTKQIGMIGFSCVHAILLDRPEQTIDVGKLRSASH